jgi:NAD-dependent deacetylase sirtuin 2
MSDEARAPSPDEPSGTGAAPAMGDEDRSLLVEYLRGIGLEEDEMADAIAQIVKLAAAHEQEQRSREPIEPLLEAFEGHDGVAAVAQGIVDGRFKNVVVMCGAGISVAAGIPDFRTPGTGLYDNLQKYDLPDPQSIFEINYFKERPSAFYHLAKELFPGTFAPTPTHYLLRLLHEKGVLLRCFSQNIDSLETLAGLPKEKMVAAHGNFDSAHCVTTGAEVPVDEVREAILAGEEGWQAMRDRYGGLVKPDIVFFGEKLPPRFQECMMSDLPQCDLLIVMGTSLKVQPFASLVGQVASDVPRLLINREKAGERMGGIVGMLQGDRDGFDFSETNYRDACFLGDCDDGARALASSCGWGDELERMCVSQYDSLIAQGQVSMAICYCHRGASHALLGDEAAAERDFRKALEIDSLLTVAADQLVQLVGAERAGLEVAAACTDPMEVAAAQLDAGQMQQLQQHLAAVRIQRVMRKRAEADSQSKEPEPEPVPEPELEPEPEPAAAGSATKVPSIADSLSHISGLWQGSRIGVTSRSDEAASVEQEEQEEQEEEEEPLEWVLSLQRAGDDLNTPTAFGATVVKNEGPFTLRGGWTQSTGKVELMAVPENFPEGDDLHYEYEAALLLPGSSGASGGGTAPNTWRLEGKWRTVTGAEVAAAVREAEAEAEAAAAAAASAEATGDGSTQTIAAPEVARPVKEWSGTFSCELLVVSDDTGGIAGMGGLFLGEAAPAAHLADSVPRNPINWCLAALPASSSDQQQLMCPLVGAGFFDDSGDFPGSPVLWFYLEGSIAADTGKFTLNKIYERKTGAMTIAYTGEVVAVSGDSGSGMSQLAELKGEWANADQGTFGVFGCRQEARQGTMPAPCA